MIRRLLLLCVLIGFNSVALGGEHPLIFASLVNAPSETAVTSLKTFANLSSAEQFYRQLARQGRWPTLASGPLLREGDRHQQVVVMRQQLYLLGDYPRRTLDTLDANLFDNDLNEALKRFQYRHGVAVDGILGPESRRLLNLTPTDKLAQLQLNQLRSQQFKEQLSDQKIERYIQVNIPEYRLHLLDGEKELLQMKVIVGKKNRKTPLFTTEIKGLLLNPSWTVPKSIAYRDIIPRWQQNPDYLSRNNYQVVRGWGASRQQVSAAEVDLKQLYLGQNYQYFWKAPGAGNPLGRIKFLSHSEYAVYLHDTSAPRLFDYQRRAVSSGCIRVERAQDLAQMLLQLDSPDQQMQLQQGLAIDDTKEIYLHQPMPVHITYWTAWIDRDGLLNFRNDIYNLDALEMGQRLSLQNEQAAVKKID